ncbi:excisionase family DNA-binding protein [Roseovarius ramblicola]|uniref:Excisionase family DNA-binding protein n=1 Tax=Roseovarius ramblicola TaxID=2022336 RepID=A0ABV5I290_9RHOB
MRKDQRPVTPAMLAERWQCSAETIRQMVHRQELRAFRVGRMIRIPWDAVEEIECQTSQSDDCEAGPVPRGTIPAHGDGGAITVRHALDRRRNSGPETDT